MVDGFFKWFGESMDKIGYRELAHAAFNGATETAVFKNGIGNQFGVVYCKRALDPMNIREVFKVTNIPIVHIVDSSLVDIKTINLEWLRAIHALYYGRIYSWDGKDLIAIHYDRQSAQFATSQPIEITDVKFEHVDCWLKSFPGQFFIAGFDDGPFWKGEQAKRQRKQKEPPRTNANEQYWREQYTQQTHNNPNYSEKATEDLNEEIRRKFEEYMRGQGYYSEQQQAPRYNAPTGDKWLTMLLEPGTLEGAKKKFRELAHEHHPDKAGDSPEVIATMQLINAAYARAKVILS